MEPMDTNIIEEKLVELPGWTFASNKLSKEFVHTNFRDAISFIVRLSFEAEALNHHPELENVYNRVQVSLTTHDAGNKVTSKDFTLASAIESISHV